MLHAKFQDNRTFGSEDYFQKDFTLYWTQYSHLGHVTWTI